MKCCQSCELLSSFVFNIVYYWSDLQSINDNWSLVSVQYPETNIYSVTVSADKLYQRNTRDNLPTSQSQLQLNPGPNCQFRPNFGASWFLDSPMPQSTDGQTNYIMLDNGFYSRVNQVFTLNVGLRIPFQVYRNDDILMHIFRHLHFNTCWYFFWKNPKPKRGHFILRKIHLLIYYEKPGSFIQMA